MRHQARYWRVDKTANTAVSAVAAVALGLAATGSVANVLAVFGVWALPDGVAQLVVTLRRRARLGNQWPLLIAGGGSVVFGVIWDHRRQPAGAAAPSPQADP